MNKFSNPPKLPLRFFRWFCHPDYVEDIEGDLLERYENSIGKKSRRSANWLFVLEILKLLSLELIRPLGGFKKMNSYGMFKNNLKTTFRFLQNHKAFTMINLIGLSIGILVSFYALLYVNFELSYDTYHQNSESIYRLVTDVHTPNEVKKVASSVPMAPAIYKLFPEVKNYARVFLDYAMIQSSPETYMRDDYAYVDSAFFSVFSFQLISGNRNSVINNTPYDAVLSRRAAIKYFGTTDCIGKSLTIDGSTKVFVTAVMEDIPENSHFQVDILLSLKLLTEVWNPRRNERWELFDCYTYLQLIDNFDLEGLNENLSKLVNERISIEGTSYKTNLEPLTSLYLLADPRGYRTGTSKSGNIVNVYTIGVIGALVLFMAIFNFVNLSTALSLNRTKEIGVRKVLGAKKSQLRIQFLIDAMLLALISYLLSMVLLWVTAERFHEIVGKVIFDTSIFKLEYAALMLGLTIIVGFVSGIYPAFFLSNIKSECSIKGNFSQKLKSNRLYRYLIVAQFVVSVFLVVFALGVYQQLKFVKNADLGYNKEHKLILDFFFDRNIKKNESIVRQELVSLAGVPQVSFSSSVPGHTGRQFITQVPKLDGQLEQFTASLNWIDFEFHNQYEMKIVAGRTFDKDLISDIGNTMIINEAAAKLLGYQNLNEVIGKPFKQQNRGSGTIIGVVKDFHHFSLKEKIQPMTFQYNPSHYTFATVTISNSGIFETIDQIKAKWIQFKAKRPFDYHFLDLAYQKQYESDNRFGELLIWFSFIAVFISNLGLLGISAFNVVQRTKEIGIRKILGANTSALLRLISTDFLKLIMIGIIIGIPISLYGLNRWLESFAYQTSLPWWLFSIAVITTLGVSFITIASQVTRTALSNPINALRDE